MIDTSYQKKFLWINQIWYPKDVRIHALLREKRKADILFIHGVPVEETKGNFRGWQEYHTCISDLTMPEDELLAKINKNVRYEIRRSEKDEIETRFYGKPDVEADKRLLTAFSDLYERMYVSKGLDTKFNMTAIKKYLETDNIFFSAVWHQDEMIVFHSYVRDQEDTRLLHSASCFREESTADQAMIGRANKRLQWEDMKYFKKEGLIRYDWGGISDFENPNGIDAFKLKFGGDKVTYYNVFAGNTILGKAAVMAMKLLKRLN